MFTIPTVTFFVARSYFSVEDPDRDTWACIASLVSVWFVIIGIIIWKYSDDFKAVFIDGTGDVPYDQDQQPFVDKVREKYKKLKKED